MTAELTFVPGRVPGIARSSIGASKAPARRPPVHAAAPASPDRDLLPGMTARQRHALAALVHTSAGDDDSRYAASRGGANVAWIAVLACALAWTMAIALELSPDLRVAWRLDVPRVAQPHVDARVG